MGGVGRDVVQRVVGVYEAPVLGRGAVVRKWVVLLERRRIKIDPLAFAAIEVLREKFSSET